MTIERFSPTVLLKDGTTYAPKGWEWILAFALHGCDWAIKDALKPEFRKMIIKDLKKTKRQNLNKSIDEYLIRIESLKNNYKMIKK